MNIGIIGAGRMGRSLARAIVHAGHSVKLANARGPETIGALASGLGAVAVTVRDAAQHVDIVILSIPQGAIGQLPAGLFDDVPQDVIVIDTGNYYPGLRDRRIAAIEEGMAESLWVSQMLRRAATDPDLAMMTDIVRQIALTGCRRSEIIGLRWSDVDLSNSCLRLSDSKEGASIRPIGLAVVEFLEKQREDSAGDYVFPGSRGGKAYGAFPNKWKKIFVGTALETITAHVLRHSFASIANDLGLSEITIAALLGHANSSVTSRYVHTLDNTLVMAADTVSGYIQGLLDGKEFKQTAYAFDRCARKASLEQFLQDATE